MEFGASQGQSVQPNEGQGGEPEGAESFVDQHLEQIPDDYREHVEPYLRDIEKNANERFQEHAEYKKQWEPYEELGLSDVSPEDLQQLLQFAELANDPEQFKDWWQRAGEEAGWFDSDDDDDDYDDDDDDYDDDDDDEDVQQLLDQMLEQKLGPILQRESEREQQEALSNAESEIESQVEALKEKHGDFDEQAVYRFALAYADSDSDNAIEKGFGDYQKFLADIENGAVSRKAGNTPPPEGGGPASTSQSSPTDFKEAKEMARERLAQLRQG